MTRLLQPVRTCPTRRVQDQTHELSLGSELSDRCVMRTTWAAAHTGEEGSRVPRMRRLGVRTSQIFGHRPRLE
eukprot:4670775-Prymnesium_polylepis.1